MLKRTLAAWVAALMLAGAPVLADWTPKGPIMLWIGFGAGGETDVLGRVLAEEMSVATGWEFRVRNKPGGGGMAMFTQLAMAAPDGQTLGMGVTMPVLVNLVTRPEAVPFGIDSFDYIGTAALAQLAIIAAGEAPFDTFAGLVEWSKGHGGARIGFDAKPQELLIRFVNAQSDAGLQPVPMQSGAEELQHLLGGQFEAAFNAGTHLSALERGEVKMLASANAARHGYAPDVATLKEQGFDIYVDPWFYIAAPAGLPEEAHAALAEAMRKAVDSRELRNAIMSAMQTLPSDKGPEGTRAMMESGLKNVAALFGK